jgi:hypothetical protein
MPYITLMGLGTSMAGGLAHLGTIWGWTALVYVIQLLPSTWVAHWLECHLTRMDGSTKESTGKVPSSLGRRAYLSRCHTTRRAKSYR